MTERPFDVQLQHGVAQVLDQRRANGRVVGQVDDVLVLVGYTQFLLRADHGPRGDAADLGLLQFFDTRLLGVGVPKTSALHCKGHFEVQIALAPKRQQAGRPRNDDFSLRAAVLHLGQHQPVGVGVVVDGAELAHHDFLRIPGQIGLRQSDVLYSLHLQPGQRQPLGQLTGGDGDVYVVSQPGQGYSHDTLLLC